MHGSPVERCYLCDIFILKIRTILRLKNKMNDPARIRTWNPLIRSQMPYPLGHRACLEIVLFILNSLNTSSSKVIN